MKPVRNTKTQPVISTLNEVISYFGLPETLISDRGTAFTSGQFKKFCDTNQINHVKTAVRTPRANGQVERSNSTILDMLRTSTTEPRDWDAKIAQLQWMLNSQTNATTRFTPNELVFHFNPRDAVHNHLVAAISDAEQPTQKFTSEEKCELALQNIAKEREKWKSRFDRSHATPTKYNEGDLVVITFEPSASGESRKLEARYRGPYIVAKILNRDRYLIEDVPGMRIKSRPFSSVYTAEQMKPWCNGYPVLDDDDETITDDSDIEDSVSSGSLYQEDIGEVNECGETSVAQQS